MLRILPITLLLGCGPALVPLRPTSGDPLEPIDWLAGSWVGEEAGRTTEEHWTQPSGGIMVGMNRTAARGRTEAFEYLRIEARDEGVVYVASPGGGAATEFRARALPGPGEDRIVFENPEHDYPQKIEYWIYEGELHVRIQGARGARAKEWTWQRAVVAAQ